MKKKAKDIGYIIPQTHWDREWRYPLWKNRMLLVELMEELLHVICTHYLPDDVIAASDPGDPSSLSELPLLEGKTPLDKRPAVYVCRNFTCQSPVTDPVELRKLLNREKASI